MPHLSPMNWINMFVMSWMLIFILALSTTYNKNNKMKIYHSTSTPKNLVKY